MKYRINGKYIEIFFEGMPDTKIRETLKICGWYWFDKNRCWRNINTIDNMELVKALEKELSPKTENPLLSLRREKY